MDKTKKNGKYFLPVLSMIVLTGGLLRFAIAPERKLEYRRDTVLFQAWGYSAYEHGILNIYTTPVAHPIVSSRGVNYLPPELYILWGTEWFRRWIAPESDIGTSLASVVGKAPAILFDLGTVILLAAIIKEQASGRRALTIAAAYALHPGIIFTTAGWGQVDGIHTFFLVLCVWLIGQKRLTLAATFFTVAFFFKMQSLAIAPLLIYELARTSSLRTVVKAGMASVGTAALLNLPLLLAGRAADILRVVFTAPGTYPWVSINAFNLWWVLSGGHGFTFSDETFLWGIVPIFLIGTTLFMAAVWLALWFRSRVRSSTGLWLTAAFLVFAFFMLPTEMHERYLFPVFALLSPTMPSLVPSRWLYGGLSATFAINLAMSWGIQGGDVHGLTWAIALIVSTINVVIFLGMSLWFVRLSRRSKNQVSNRSVDQVTYARATTPNAPPFLSSVRFS